MHVLVFGIDMVLAPTCDDDCKYGERALRHVLVLCIPMVLTLKVVEAINDLLFVGAEATHNFNWCT